MNVDHQSVPRLVKSQKRSYNKGKRKNDDLLKVVYISSPMKVKTSASKFRSLVQELTGKNSDISRYMDDNNTNGDHMNFREFGCDDGGLSSNEVSDQQQVFSSISSEDTTTSSDTFLGPMDNMFISSQILEEQFGGIFSSSSFYDASQLDVLGSYDELL